MSFSTSISDRAARDREAQGAGAPHSRRAWGLRYLLRLGIVAAAALMLSALLVWSVDPYGLLGHNTLGIYAESERQAKPAMLRAAQPDSVLIGSSKVAYTDPGTLGPHAFNASFSAAMPEEIVNFLRLHVPPGTRVVVGLDSYMMNETANPYTPETFSQTPSRFETLAYLFGLRPAWASVTAVWDKVRGRPPTLRANGQRHSGDRLARHHGMDAPDHERWMAYLSSHHFADFDYSQRRVGDLAELLEVARERRLTLYVFVNPLSAPVRDLVNRLPAGDAVARFRAEVQAALPGVVDLAMDPRFAAPDLYFRFDPFHYLPSTGVTILEEVLAHPPVYSPPAANAAATLGVVRGDDYTLAAHRLTLKRVTHGLSQDSAREAVQ